MNIRNALIKAKATNVLGVSRDNPTDWYIDTSPKTYYHLIYKDENGEPKEDVHILFCNYNDLTATDWHIVSFRKGNKYYG